MLTARAIFLYKFFCNPGKIGSITQSSSFLTRKMLADLPWERIETIAELGAGTGVFTNYIAENKKRTCQVVVIEEDWEMRGDLQRRHPDFIFGAKAEKLDWLLQRHSLPQVDCIVSGLPFAAFAPAQRQEIMAAVRRSLKPEGLFVAFQYSLQMKEMLQSLFGELKITFEPLNLPPAFVYRCRNPLPPAGNKMAAGR